LFSLSSGESRASNDIKRVMRIDASSQFRHRVSSQRSFVVTINQ
jgi:hypothetical protein